LFTDFSLSQQLIIDVNSVLGFLQHVVVGDVANGSEMHAVSTPSESKYVATHFSPQPNIVITQDWN
jgi:hypothetical protein